MPLTEERLPLLTHALHVHVRRFPALAGVLFRYAESAELNRSERLIWYDGRSEVGAVGAKVPDW
jgi:hypothetical protein